MSWREFTKKGMNRVLPHKFFGRKERLVWRIITLSVSNPWITLPGPSKWWSGYSEADFRKYWDVPSGKTFEEIVNLSYVLFTNQEAPENVVEIINKVQGIQKMYQ
jgi:hypothetical protein